jgi:hypothetical protein
MQAIAIFGFRLLFVQGVFCLPWFSDYCVLTAVKAAAAGVRRNAVP